jgi:hypothetical protein
VDASASLELARILPDWAMANAITAFATILAGVYTVTLWLLLPGQPWRWGHAYLWILVTGIPTLGLHGYGEPFRAPSHPYWGVADTGTNLLLAWALQVAVLGDFWSRRTQWRVGAASLVVNVCGIGHMAYERFFAAQRSYLLPLGDFGGFYTGEALLILDSLLVTALLVVARSRLTRPTRRLLALVAATFVCGLGLATASNQQVGVLLGVPVLAFHALWHLVGAFGFMVFFLFNHLRFEDSRGGSVERGAARERAAA